MTQHPPTVQELISQVKNLTKTNGAFHAAWKNSFPDKSHCCERGGFIYIDFPIHRPITKAYVQMAPKGSSMNQRTKGPNASINLNRPGINMKNVILVANFHTHPLSEEVEGRPEPSTSDMNNAYHRGLPGIVISRKGIFAYGPSERSGTKNPRGYASSVTLHGVPRPHLVRGRPIKIVQNQWPEGTGLKPGKKTRTRELDLGEEETFEIPGLEKGKKLLGHISSFMDKVAPHKHDHHEKHDGDDGEGEVSDMDCDEGMGFEGHGDSEDDGNHGEVLFVDWSEEGIEYGEDLPEAEHD